MQKTDIKKKNKKTKNKKTKKKNSTLTLHNHIPFSEDKKL